MNEGLLHEKRNLPIERNKPLILYLTIPASPSSRLNGLIIHQRTQDLCREGQTNYHYEKRTELNWFTGWIAFAYLISLSLTLLIITVFTKIEQTIHFQSF